MNRIENRAGPFRVVVITSRGLSHPLRHELRRVLELDSAPRPAAPDSWVEVMADRAEQLVGLVDLPRIAQRVIVDLASPMIRQDAGGLSDIAEAVRDVDFSPWLGPETTFAVRCDRRGRQSFGSPDAAGYAGGAVVASVESRTGRRPRVSLDDPDVLFRLEILDDKTLFGVDLSAPRSLHRRGYLIRPHRAAVKSTVASALLDLIGWTPGRPLLDPMCGGGTFLLEAALEAARVPAGFFRRPTSPFHRLPLFDGVDLGAIYAQHDAAIDLDRVEGLVGGDISRPTIEAALANAREARLEGCIEWIRAAVGELPGKLDGRRFPFVAVNPPYGIRMGTDGQVQETYALLFRTLDAVVEPDGLVTLLSPRASLVFSLARHWGFPAKRRKLWVGDLKLGAFRLGPRGGPHGDEPAR